MSVYFEFPRPPVLKFALKTYWFVQGGKKTAHWPDVGKRKRLIGRYQSNVVDPPIFLKVAPTIFLCYFERRQVN